METKEIKIEIPEGYEIDKEKSTFVKIVFKKKEKIINTWDNLHLIEGCYIGSKGEIINYKHGGTICSNRNIFLNEKYAKSALALAQISQLLPYYDTNVDWDNNKPKWCIAKSRNNINIDCWQSAYHLLAFNTKEEAERFLKHNEQLVKDYYMI